MSFEYRFPLPLVVAGVPIPGRSNPYMVLLTPKDHLRIIVDVDEAETPSARVEGVRLGWRFELAVKSFVDTLSGRLEQPVVVQARVAVEGLGYPPPASVYAALTLALVDAVASAGGYSMEPGEVLEAANSIDEEGGVGLDYINALRASLTVSTSIVYRAGEEPVELPGEERVELELVGEEDLGEDITGKLGEPLASALTRLAGVAVVEAARRIREGGNGIEALRLVARVDNALYYLLYGVQTPEGPCKWTPSLQRVYGVCLERTGIGDVVEFTL